MEDTRAVSLLEMVRFRAHKQVQFLTCLESLGHLGDDPGPEPVSARRMLGVFRQQVDRSAHSRSPPSFHEHHRALLSCRTVMIQNTLADIVSAAIRE